MEEIVRTERLEIVDKLGNCLAVLGQDEDQLVGLTLYDQGNRKRINLRIRDNGNPEILLYNEDSEVCLKIFVNQKDEPKIMLTDGCGTNIIKIAVSEDDEPVLELRDDYGKTRVGLFVSDEDAGVAVFDSDKDLIASLPKRADLLDALGTAARVIGIIRAIA